MLMKLDFASLAIVMFITNLLQVAALYIQSRLANKYQGVGWWTAGIASIALGFLAMFLRGVPGLTSIGVFANNLFFVGGHMLLYTGVLRFFERSVPRRALLGCFAAYTLVDIYFVFIYDHLVWRGSLLYLTISGLSFLTAWTLWKRKPSSLSVPVHFLAGTFILHGSVFFIGFLLGLLAPPSSNSPTGANAGQLLGILDGIIVSTLWTLGFILMVNQRLHAGTREAQQDMELIFNASPDAVLVTRLSDGLVLGINEGFTSVSGYARAEAIGTSTLSLRLWKNPADRQAVVAALSEHGACSNLEFEFVRKDGSEFTGLYAARLIALRGAPHVLSAIHDVTERKQLEKQLQEQAATDALTGVANRRRFLHSAEAEIKRALRLSQPLSVALIDIDFFKQINDNHGHQVGDQVLTQFAGICTEHVREIDLVARIGGDEFAILLPLARCSQAYEVIERIRAALADSGMRVPVTITAGVACIANGADSLDGLMGRADQALYRAKHAGRNRTGVDQATS